MWGLLGRRQRFFQPAYVQYVGRTLFFGPVLVGLVSLWLFAFVPQMREVYLGLIESLDHAHALGGLASVLLLSALLYAWSHRLSTLRIDAIYPLHADIYFDRNILKIRNLWGGFGAVLPLAGIVVGLAVTSWQAAGAADNVQTLLDSLAARPTEYSKLADRLRSISTAAFVICCIAAVAAVLYMRFLYFAKDSQPLQAWILRIAHGVAVVVAAGPLVLPDYTLSAARTAGPLAASGLVLVAGTVLLRFIVQAFVHVARRLVVAGSAVVMVVTWLSATAKWMAAGLTLVAFLLWLGKYPGDADAPSDRGEVRAWLPEREQADIATRFDNWFSERRDRPTAGKYPVFIVAAQGGGIYAASSATSFLSVLQERCSNFAQHVFAISAVSGGAVGSTIFNAMLADTPQRDVVGCQPLGASNLTARSNRIILADHLSPLVARLVPDFILDIFLPEWLRLRLPGVMSVDIRRQDLLESGFARSFMESAEGSAGSNPRTCPLVGAVFPGLAVPFHAHWCPGSAAPALVLNSTWVETGYRVAFAPFPLPASDGTLYGFSELQRTPAEHDRSLSLIRAAVISARYPLITSPWSFVRRSNHRADGSLENRWTFVDGGYADNSGATTALDLFRALDTHIKSKELNVDLRLIVLTDALVEPDFTHLSSSWLGSLLSPVSAVLNVRSLLARRAVTQAVNHINDDERLIRIQLEERIFPLPLGWKISATANAIIGLSIGQPELCPGDAPSNAAGTANTPADTVKDNSCKMRKLLALISRAS